MEKVFESNMRLFRQRLAENQIDVALITDEDNVYYLTGYYDYLHMEFGRPTILVVQKEGSSLLITPLIDFNSAEALARVDRIAPWNDGVGFEWREELPGLVKNSRSIAIEPNNIPGQVRRYICELTEENRLKNASRLLYDMRMIKSDQELKIARHAGQVANAMMTAGREAISNGIPEYEVAIATAQAGTRMAAKILSNHYADSDMSPNIHFLQIMASGEEITKTHHRASGRIMQIGDPVFLCFCGMTNFHRFKLGFDRVFWIGEIQDRSQAAVYEIAIDSQKAALEALRPGVTAESVHAAYAEVIKMAGYDYPFRCGRATGFSFLESPQLISGDKTILQPGMVLAVDGSVSTDNFRAQVGDSVIITNDGFESITSHPKQMEDIIV